MEAGRRSATRRARNGRFRLTLDLQAMVDDKREAHDQRDRPEPGMQGECWDRAYGAKSEERRVDRNTCADQGFDVFFEPIDGCRFAFQHEGEVGGDRRDTDRGHTEHDRLTDTQRLPGASDRSDQEQRLQGNISPLQISTVIGLVDETTMAIPGEVQREDGKTQHHPAKDSTYPFWIFEMRMSVDGIDERADADADRSRTRYEHAPREYASPLAVKRAALATRDGNPERHESKATREDVQHDEALEGEHDPQHP